MLNISGLKEGIVLDHIEAWISIITLAWTSWNAR